MVLLLALAVVAGRTLYPFGFRAEVVEAATRFGLDPALVAAVIRTESRFRPDATSPKGARGLMQVMPDTGAWVAARLELSGFQPDHLYDPALNITIGTYYLADLRREFGPDLILVLAAYNAGRQNVKNWLTQQAGGDIALTAIPFPETRQYVRNVLTAYRWYQALYGY